MGQYERRFEERGVPAGRQTRGVPPEQQAREQELVEPEADNPARKVDKPRRLPSTRLAMARHPAGGDQRGLFAGRAAL